MSERIDREIEEILRRLDSHPARRRRSLRWRLRSVVTSLWGAVASRVRGISLGQVMIGSFLIICVAYFFRYLNPQLMRWIIIAGLLLFFASFVLSLRRSNSPISRERRWRGQRVDYDEPNLAERLRSWFDRSRRGRRW